MISVSLKSSISAALVGGESTTPTPVLGPELWTYGVVIPDGTGVVNEILAGVSSGAVEEDTTYRVEWSWVNLTGRAEVKAGAGSTATAGGSLTNDTDGKTQDINSGSNTRLYIRDKLGGLTADSITISVKKVL